MSDRRIAPGESQNQTPFSKRLLDYRTKFLPMTVPFHHAMLEAVIPIVTEDCKTHGVAFDAKLLQRPLLSTLDGINLQSVKGDIIPELASLIAAKPVNWMKVVGAINQLDASHVLDFGPGNPSPSAALTVRA